MKKQIAAVFLTTLVLSGCGDHSTETYASRMNDFITGVSTVTAELDAVDPSASDAQDTVLSKLSELSSAFHDAADYEIPSDYSDLAAPMSNAATYMAKAYETYASACTAETFDAEAAGIAIGYYESSMESLARVGELLKSHETGN